MQHKREKSELQRALQAKEKNQFVSNSTSRDVLAKKNIDVVVFFCFTFPVSFRGPLVTPEASKDTHSAQSQYLDTAGTHTFPDTALQSPCGLSQSRARLEASKTQFPGLQTLETA